ncbi:DNA polymerase III epsilon subunit [Marinobacterium lacunae]|uniref:DNA polymerase III epsilon subunit n=1 Tax=Marinobacterium lacunae TaxID=1232683 RepID=A0A081G0K0_9GAMM|nr:3'-5' exonuclease [Marinobacterium lacunae]KEA64305.1 DNA polymerase III epsilon subunit [Marinobacterium lacunae]
MIIPRTIRRFQDRRTHRNGPWAALFEAYGGDEVVSLDCETTSLDVNRAEILSIGAVRIQGTKVKTSDRLDLRLKPPQSLSGESIKVHKIRASDLSDGIEIEEAMDLLLNFIGNRPILGYYVNYDIRVIDKFLRPVYGFGLPNKAIELSHVYHDIIKWKHVGGDIDLRFDTIASKLDIPIIQRHTALGDAITVALMYVRLKHGQAPVSTH